MSSLLREYVIKPCTRDSRWPKVRKAHLLREPMCANCGTTKRLQVHHIIPVHVKPIWELEMGNLITLCAKRECHLEKGHLGYWKSWNTDVIRDCMTWFMKRVGRP